MRKELLAALCRVAGMPALAGPGLLRCCEVSAICCATAVMPEGKGIERLYRQRNRDEIPFGQEKARFKENESVDNAFNWSSGSNEYRFAKKTHDYCQTSIGISIISEAIVIAERGLFTTVNF